MMRVVAADDEPLSLQRLTRELGAMADVSVVGVASDGDSLLKAVAELRPDLVILDVRMPGRDGMAAAAALPPEGRPEIVFLTAYDRYAAEAFAIEALDYLLKPVRPERLRQAVERAHRRRADRLTGDAARRMAEPEQRPFSDLLHLPDRSGGRNLPQADILWIEAARDYAIIHTAAESAILRVTMANLATRLHPSLLRVHRSAFVSVRAVRRQLRQAQGSFSLLLADGARVQVGPSYAKAIKARLRTFRPDLRVT